MSKLTKTTAVVCVSICVGIAWLSESASPARPTGPVIQNPNQLAEHIAGAPARLRSAEWGSQKAKYLSANGMETGSAGIRLIRPCPDPHSILSPYSDDHRSGGYWFWGLNAAYESNEYCPALPFAIDLIDASYTRVLKNTWFDAAVVQDSGASTYSVEATFNAGGIGKVATLIGTQTSGGDFQDWFGVNQLAGGVATEMLVVMVSDSLAYLPFSATDVANGSAPHVVTLAKGLTYETATKMVAHLER